MAEIISSDDITAIRQARQSGAKRDALPDAAREAYQRIHERLRTIAEVGLHRLGGSGSFASVLTSGLNPNRGVRGYQPKDLWLVVYHKANETKVTRIYQAAA